MAPDVVKFAMAVKAFRIALLIVSLPVAARFLERRTRVPWYLVAFFVVGIVFWVVPVAPAIVTTVGEVQAVALPAALATVGLRADIGVVGARLVKPLLLIVIVFALDVGVFWATRGFALAT
jgi:uncharacterized membrane protein YadS